MKVTNVKIVGSWHDVANAARTTIHKEERDPTKEITSEWKTRMLLAEHSPIRLMSINWTFEELPSWISVHLVRHKIGIEHFVSTQRPDRVCDATPRHLLPQTAPVTHRCVANFQAIINISRKRLCMQASEETRNAWSLFLQAIEPHEPELYNACIPDCIYRGACFEYVRCNKPPNKDVPYRKRHSYR
jgi:hypothetical protein